MTESTTPVSDRSHAQWTATIRFAVAGLAAAVVGVGAAAVTDPSLAVLLAIATLSAVFDLSTVSALLPMDAASTRLNARREAFQPAVEELVVLTIAVGSVVGIAVLQVLGDTASRDTAAAVGLVGVFTTWAAIHLMYTAQYANLYHQGGSAGTGIDFNTDEPPTYRDFAYFSFTIGMTYAVSDCNISAPRIRSTALRHALLSFLFGTLILAATINLIAGIVT